VLSTSFRELFGCESLGRTEHHVSGIVDDYIEPSALRDDRLNRRVHRFLRCDIELDGTEVHFSFSCVFLDGLHRSRIATSGFAHAGIDTVSSIG
jgi:hypothetical protein